MQKWLASLGRHRALKLLSLLLALALWFAVSGEERTETSLHMALEFVNLPAKMVITGEIPAELQVRVIGPRSIVNKLFQTRLTQTIDMASYKSGPHTFYLGPNSFSFPRGVVVTRIQPNPLTLNLSPTISATLPIKPVLAGNPPEGYELVNAKTRPDQVTVSGPLPELSDLKFIPTHPIDLRRLTELTVTATDLDFKNLHLTLKDQIPILAELDIQPKTLIRILSGVPVLPEPGPARLQPAQVAVTVQGLWPRVKDLKPADVKAAVDTRNLGRTRARLAISVSLPEGVSLVRVQPGWVSASKEKTP
ncbi:MAG: CdaR family protein [Deltaproteobacteria bacterium]|nr:CdaR family protein [Deltaproteobacteria bacterium]